MTVRRPSPFWPYLTIVACLFVLSLAAPSSWYAADDPPQPLDDWPLRATWTPAPVDWDVSSDLAATFRLEKTAVEAVEPGPTPTEVPSRQVLSLAAPVRAAVAAAPAVSPPGITSAWHAEGPKPGATSVSATAGEPIPASVGAPREPSPPRAVRRETIVRVSDSGDRLAQLPPRHTSPAPILLPTDNPSERAEPSGQPPAPDWPLPVMLQEKLTELAAVPGAREWARQVSTLVDELCRKPTGPDARIAELLAELRQAARSAEELIAATQDAKLREQCRRAQHALARRVDLWQTMQAYRQSQLPDASRGDAVLRQLREILADITRQTEGTTSGQAWREYLELDALRELTSDPDGLSADEQRRLSRRVLSRLAEHRLSAEQREFATQGALAELPEMLKHWAWQPVDTARLLKDVERYESDASVSVAERIGADYWSLRYTPTAAAAELADVVDRHYRNANFRVAVSSALINRLLPEVRPTEQEVNDVIVGADVFGQSLVTTRLLVRTLPDNERARLGLEARGNVASQTTSYSGPASFNTSGSTTYLARKLIQIGPAGIHVWPAVAESNTDQQLLALQTEYDGIPLLGIMVRGIAISKHDEAQGQAHWEVQRRVSDQVSRRLDEEADARIRQAEQRFEQRILSPLQRLSLAATPVSMYSTDQRIISRVRLASDSQLGGHTARPLAPSDSLLSLQLHETSLNNALCRLQLEGGHFTFPELYRKIGERIGRPDLATPEDLDDRATIRFADEQALRIGCDDGLIQIELAVAELTMGRNRFQNFVARAKYRPVLNGIRADLALDGVVQLDAEERIATRSQIVLRSVFSRIFPRSRPFELVGDSVAKDARLADLKITQFDIQDGWVGMAIGPVGTGPDRTAERSSPTDDSQ